MWTHPCVSVCAVCIRAIHRMRHVNGTTQKAKAINLPYAIECNLYFDSSPHSSLDIFETKIHKSHSLIIHQIQSYLISGHYTQTHIHDPHTHTHSAHDTHTHIALFVCCSAAAVAIATTTAVPYESWKRVHLFGAFC